MSHLPPVLAGYRAPECRCAHLLADHKGGQSCAADGCGCRCFRDRGDGPVVPVPDTRDPNRPF